MKIGLISDIHASYPSLIKALRIFKQVGVNKILCAGDLVEKGEQGDKVVRLIRDLTIPCVLGNHDEMAPGNQQWVKDNMDLSHRNAQNLLLQPDSIAYLLSLPRQLHFEWTGLRLLLVHGSPASNVEYLTLKTPAQRYRNHAKSADADIIIFGHSHVPLHYVVDDVHFINPGSVQSGEGFLSHTCAILTLPDMQVTVYHLDDATHELLPAKSPPD